MDSLRLTLAYFAIFDTRATNPQHITDRIRAVTQEYNPENCLNTLISEGKIVQGEFDYRYNILGYIISPKEMVPMIVWMFTTPEGKDCLRILQKVARNVELEQTTVQSIIMNYIRSGFRDASDAKNIFVIDIPYLISVFDDANFVQLFRGLTQGALMNLIATGFEDAYNNERLLNMKNLYDLLESYPFTNAEDYHRVSSTLDLYNFLAYGNLDKKKERSVKIAETHLLTAYFEAYRGKYKKAFDAFKEAQRLFTAKSAVLELRGIYPIQLHNFLYMLCCGHLEDEEAEHQFDVMLKRKNSDYIVTAQILSRILQNKDTETTSDALRNAYLKGNRMQKLLVALMVHYTEDNKVLTDEALSEIEPKWAVLRLEYSQYLHIDTAKDIKGKGLAGREPLLSTIYHKKVWENVLQNLTGTLMKGDMVLPENSSRLAYFMNDINSNFCDVRIQMVLRTGAWSNGKLVPYQQYSTLNTDYLTPGDRLIRKRNERDTFANGFQLSLTSILPEMAEESRLYVGKSTPFTLVDVIEDIPYLVIEQVEGGYQIKSNVPIDKLDHTIIVTGRSATSISFINLKDDIRPYFSHLLNLGFFPTEAEAQLKEFLPLLGNKVEIHSSLIEGGTTLKTVQGSPVLTLQMRPQGRDAYTVSLFCRPLEHGKLQCKPGWGGDSVVDQKEGKRIIVTRNLEREKTLAVSLAEVIREYTDDLYVDSFVNGETLDMTPLVLLPMIDYISEHKEDYILEWPEGQKLRFVNRSVEGKCSARIKKNRYGWFELEGEVHLDENTVLTMQQLLELMGNRYSRFIKLGDGQFIALSEKLRRQLMGLSSLASHNRTRLQISAFSAALLDESMTNGELTVDMDEELKEVRQRIVDLSEYKPDAPAELHATLRPYQLEGYQWMARLNKWGAGALLADDMGLGKTIQTISYLLLLAKEGPALVIAPASVAPNWLKEIYKFTDKLNVTFLNVSNTRSMDIANAKAGDVIIATYNLLLMIKDEVTHKHWTTVCLDEAHVIKNRGAKTSAICMQIKAKNRVMLTGTPVQNHLGELWSLFQFVNPGLLGSYEDFSRRFISPIENGNNPVVKAELEKMVKPFMLRRTKESVLKELPEKIEIYQSVGLTDEEMAVYEVIRKRAENMLLEEENQDKISLNTLAEITRLRQASCSAELVDPHWKGSNTKIQALIEDLEPIVECGDAALVFSQFTSFLTLIKEALKKANIPYLYIDGNVHVKERSAIVDKFQRGECPVFLISLKAGGLGLTLTRANYVFHMDPWWNPAIEQQATDRAHRMGQQNSVTVYHFLAANTIEEKIKKMHEQKRDLAESILEGTDMSVKLTGKELLEMVK